MIGQEHQLQQLIANVAILHNDLQKQSEDALGLQQEGISQLRNQLAEIDKLLADALAKQLSDVSENLKQEIIEGGRQGLGDFSNHLEDLKRHMSHFAEFAAVTEQRLNRASRSLMLKIGWLFGIVLVAVLGATVWLEAHYVSVIRRHKIEAEILQLYNEADTVRCGDSLCAKVQNGNTPAEYSKQGYIKIKKK